MIWELSMTMTNNPAYCYQYQCMSLDIYNSAHYAPRCVKIVLGTATLDVYHAYQVPMQSVKHGGSILLQKLCVNHLTDQPAIGWLL